MQCLAWSQKTCSSHCFQAAGLTCLKFNLDTVAQVACVRDEHLFRASVAEHALLQALVRKGGRLSVDDAAKVLLGDDAGALLAFRLPVCFAFLNGGPPLSRKVLQVLTGEWVFGQTSQPFCTSYAEGVEGVFCTKLELLKKLIDCLLAEKYVAAEDHVELLATRVKQTLASTSNIRYLFVVVRVCGVYYRSCQN